MKLEGKTAIITGAARGIGRSAAQLFSEEGAKIALFDIDEAGMAETQALVEKTGPCLSLRTDISDEGNVQTSVAQVMEAFGGVDILYNNAAFNKDFKPIAETTIEDWDKEVDVTLKGSFICSRAVLPHMTGKGSGNILMTGSWLSMGAFPGFGAYCCAKGGILQLTRTLAVDYSPLGVRVNCICPGGVDTPALDPYRDDPDFMTVVPALTLMNRIAQPGEIARVALFLASDDSSYVTGTIIPVDGGASAKL